MTEMSRLGLGFVLLAAGLLVISTGGVFTVSGTRGVDVVTGSDTSAYLGIDRFDQALTNGRHSDVTLLGLQNNFPVQLTNISVAISDGSAGPPRPSGIDWPSSLEVGERGSVTSDVVCGGPGDRSEQWTIEVIVTGHHTSLTAIRSVTIGCEPPSGPPSNGGGPNTGSPSESEGGPSPGGSGR